MLAEIAAANAAFGILKTAFENGKELFDVAESAANFFEQKAALSKKAHRNGYRSDIQAFLELEKVNEMEEHLRQTMIWGGRPGMWDDWLAFQKEAKRQRDEAERIARKQREENLQMIMMFLYFVGGLALFVPILILVLKIFIG